MMKGPSFSTRARHLLFKYIRLHYFLKSTFSQRCRRCYSLNVQIACVCCGSLSERRKRWFHCLPLPESRPRARLIIKILSGKLHCLPACQYSSLSLWLSLSLSLRLSLSLSFSKPLLSSLTHAYINSLAFFLSHTHAHTHTNLGMHTGIPVYFRKHTDSVQIQTHAHTLNTQTYSPVMCD